MGLPPPPGEWSRTGEGEGAGGQVAVEEHPRRQAVTGGLNAWLSEAHDAGTGDPRVDWESFGAMARGSVPAARPCSMVADDDTRPSSGDATGMAEA